MNEPYDPELTIALGDRELTALTILIALTSFIAVFGFVIRRR